MSHKTVLTAALAALVLGTQSPAHAVYLVGVDSCAVGTDRTYTDLSQCTLVMTGGTYSFQLVTGGYYAWSTVSCGDGAGAYLSATDYQYPTTTFVTGIGTCTLRIGSSGNAAAIVYR